MLDCAETLLDFMNTNFLSQYVDKPTRMNTLLDLVLTNDINLVKQVKAEDSELSDHKMIIVKSNFGLKPTTPTNPVFMYISKPEPL